jgi:hypothetical protein
MKTRSTTGEFFACYGEVIDRKRDTLEKAVDMSGCEERTVAIDDDHVDEVDDHDEEYEEWDVIPRSRHRDGSIYRCREPWATEYRIAVRRESKPSKPIFLFFFVITNFFYSVCQLKYSTLK